MLNRLLLLAGAWCIALSSVAQGESLRALGARPTEPEGYRKSGLNTHFIYQYDTQELPLMDDFSIDRTRKRWAQVDDAGVTLDQTIHELEVGGVSEPDMAFDTDSTFRYTIDISTDPHTITRAALPSVMVTVRDLTVYPPVLDPPDPVEGWPAYSIFDTLQSPPEDTVFQLTPDLTQDSLLVYTVPPAGGTYLMNGDPTPLILWQDDDVYVNGTYPLNPPTVGVATFDGLARTGYPYNFTQYTAHGIADHLTSVPIDLQYPPGDSIYLSFFYETVGLSGDAFLQPQDSLVLEFYAPDEDIWVHIWSSPYVSTPVYQQVMIPIKEDRFLRNGFQMRFLNYATLSGAFDHWHLDYVRLAAQRTYDDTELVDVAYLKPEASILETYTSVPFNKFAATPSSFMAQTVVERLRNLDNEDAFIRYGMTAELTTGGGAVDFDNGINTSGNASSTFPTTHSILAAPNSFTYDPSLSTDFAFWNVKFWANATPDMNRYNDTMSFVQEMSNYYAYDDGSAEMGYGLNTAGGMLAYRFDLASGDSLTALRMYFNPMANPPPLAHPTSGSFLITVWRSLAPEDIQYRNFSFSSPEYRFDGPNKFIEYPLDATIYVEGTIYVGWTQTNDVNMNLGFDRNRNNGNKIFYRTGANWANTSFEGSLMIRPVFVSDEDPFTGVLENPASATGMTIYPNPATDRFALRVEGDVGPGAMVQCLDATGRTVLQERYMADGTFSTEGLAPGIYVVRLNDGTGHAVAQGRLVVQR